MKIKFTVFSVLLFAFATMQTKSQTLIHYWDFNNTLPAGGNSGDSLGTSAYPLPAQYSLLSADNPRIVYSHPAAKQNTPLPCTIEDSILDNGSQGSYINDLHVLGNDSSGVAAGNLYIRSRNPSENSFMYLYLPTTGYAHINVSYAISASSSKGAWYNVFSYSTNGGNTWKNLTRAMDTFNTGGIFHPDSLQMINPTTAISNWYPVYINFSSDSSINNNPNFVLRWEFEGTNSNGTSGNDRYDNIAVWSTPLESIGNLPAQVAGYMVYPNPAQDFINVISDHYTGNKIITVYNLTGQIINEMENKSRQTQISTADLTPGVYFVEIKEVSSGNKYTVKIVKE